MAEYCSARFPHLYAQPGLRFFCFQPLVIVMNKLIVVLGVVLLSATSVQAQEDVEGRVCTMSGYLSFIEPLTNQEGEHQVFGEATISACVDKNGPVEGVEAEVLFDGAGTANCALQRFTLTQLVAWNDGAFDISTLQPSGDKRAPLGAYRGMVDMGLNEGNKVITALFNKEPLQSLSCMLGVEPMGTYTFSGVQIFTDLEMEDPGTEL